MDHAPEAAARSLHCTARPARWRQGAPDAARLNMGSGAAHDELETKSSRRVVDRLCTCRYSLRKAGEKATVDVETSVARESESNETRAASTPSTDVPDIMPMYSRDIMMRSACDATLELISLTKHLSGRCQACNMLTAPRRHGRIEILRGGLCFLGASIGLKEYRISVMNLGGLGANFQKNKSPRGTDLAV
jgi:hypothetical protein